jgi:hypothetical protein
MKVKSSFFEETAFENPPRMKIIESFGDVEEHFSQRK